MVLGYYNGHNPLQQLRHEMDRLWSGFLGAVPDGPWSGVVRGQPAANVWEEAGALRVEMEVPGVKSDQLDITVAGGELLMRIQRPDVQQDGVVYHRRERPVGQFTRVLRLPVEVDANHIEADLRDGVLSITLPKAESAKPRKITVASAS
jgi:HSP20 family protein